MQKAISLAKRISKELNKDFTEEFTDLSLHTSLSQIYSIEELELKDKNRICAYLIYAYDPDSQWLNLQKDRVDNKTSILQNLGANIKLDTYQEIIENKNEVVNDSIFNFLTELTDWRWHTIFTCLDYHANMIRFATQKTEEEKSIDKVNKEGVVKTLSQDYDIDVIAKVNKNKGELLEQAIKQRQKGEELLKEIKKDFVATDNAVQADFGFVYTEQAKKRNIYSWREHIQERNEKIKAAKVLP